MLKYLGLSYATSIGAFAVATCCVLPMAMMLLGLGGSWLVVFAPIAAASYYVLAASTAVVALSLIVSYRRGSLLKLRWWFGGTTVLTALAWAVVLQQTRINDFLIMQM